MKGCTNEKNGTLASVHNDTLNTIHVNFFNFNLVVVQYRVCFVCKVKDVVQIKYNEPTHVIDKHAFEICRNRPKREQKL